MKIIVSAFVIALAAAEVATAQGQCSAYSVLGNIDCGGGQATCTQSSTAQSGAVRCTCTAQCLSAQSITKTVGATRQVAWGTYKSGSGACAFPVTGEAYGRSEQPPNSGTYSAVNAEVTVSGQGIAVNRTSSVQTVDCFQGTIENDANISGVCVGLN